MAVERILVEKSSTIEEKLRTMTDDNAVWTLRHAPGTLGLTWSGVESINAHEAADAADRYKAMRTAESYLGRHANNIQIAIPPSERATLPPPTPAAGLYTAAEAAYEQLQPLHTKLHAE